jgi:dUTP pyrophosphatase
MDLTVDWIVDDGNQITIGTGIMLNLEPGMVGLIYPRSSISKTTYSLANSVGVIDSGYRGELIVVLNRNGSGIQDYEVGDRVAQLMVIEIPKLTPNLIKKEEMTTTERGEGGFGSTGK